MAIVARPRGGDWLQNEVDSWARSGFHATMSLLASEEANEFDLTGEADRFRSAGMKFLSFPIPDRGVPASRSKTLQVVRSVEAWLVAGKVVGLHCRQGIGRSGFIAACLLIPAKAGIQRIDNILKRLDSRFRGNDENIFPALDSRLFRYGW
jgi:protein-tyrosine phosphatase